MLAPTVFISYAREDDAHRAELCKHLRPWTDDGRLRIWDDCAIDCGGEWKSEISQALDKAAIIVFLVSADLLASDFVHEVELPRALERRRCNEAVLIPVIVRACPWRETLLGHLQALPRAGDPIPTDNPDLAWAQIAEAIAEAAASPTKEPEPDYPDERTRDLSLSLADAYRREEELVAAGSDLAAVHQEILKIKREMREDGLAPGDLLSGRYKLLEPIGQGGFAKVWKAWDQDLRHLVAVKVLHQQYARDRTRCQRFFRGAKQMTRLLHPRIVRILGEVECRDGSCRFFVMEYVDGGDLRRSVLSGTLEPEDRLRIVRDVGAALDDAHEQNIVHRDVKPANVLLDRTGRAKLTDFDLVWAHDSTGGTRTGMLGTAVYAAPESLERAKEAGVAADVFGLGMTAVFALHGADLPARELLRDAPGFAWGLDAPERVRAALARAVAWEPEKRHGSVGELCADLVPTRTLQRQPATTAPAIKKASVDLEDRFLWIETPVDGRVPLWREIPAGEGWIGSPRDDGYANERPRHKVKVLRPFLMAAVPVTVGQFNLGPMRALRGSLNRPVTSVDWNGAIEFCEWLSGTFTWARGARLPTEEEWEYACRAGTKTRYWSGDEEANLDRVGWYAANSDGARLVGEKPSNPWSLYDVHGNVWEWTLSPWKSDYTKQKEGLEIDPAFKPADPARGATASAERVVRGGSFWFDADRSRSAFRVPRLPKIEDANQGFRILIPLTPDSAPAAPISHTREGDTRSHTSRESGK